MVTIGSHFGNHWMQSGCRLLFVQLITELQEARARARAYARIARARVDSQFF